MGGGTGGGAASDSLTSVSGGHLWPELRLLPSTFAKNLEAAHLSPSRRTWEFREFLFSRPQVWVQQGPRNIKGEGKQVADPEAE